MSLQRPELESYLNQTLFAYEFSDYGPNGLQIEGTDDIKKIAFAVSATVYSIEEAIKQGADTLIVHHGLFWKFHGVRTLTGPFAKRVLPLVKNNLNLFGYHLPLDAHLELGNAASIAKKINLKNLQPFGDYKGSPTGVYGEFDSPLKPHELKETLEKTLNHQVLHSSPQDLKEVKSMGIITGGANSGWVDAMKLGLHSYLTGEMSEHDWHESKEAGVHMFAGGHNATEQFGIQSLMENLQENFKIECFFIPSENPA